MKEPATPTWTFDELIAAKERSGFIGHPFSPDERALALSVAEAFMWAHMQKELPGGRWEEDSDAFTAWGWGILMVRKQRRDATKEMNR